MQEKYIDCLLTKCIYPKSKSLFIAYDKVNKDFVDRLIKKTKKLGYINFILNEDDIELEYQILKESSISKIKQHPYFNRQNWNRAAKEKYDFLIVANNFDGYLYDITQKKIMLAQELKNKMRYQYMQLVAEDTISWTIFSLPNKYWANKIFPNDKYAYQKLENMIYSFCLFASFNDYLRIENKKTVFLNNLQINELILKNDLGTNLTIKLVDNYIFRSLEKNHCIENLPTYSIWSMPDKNHVDGIVYGSLPISINGILVKDYWFKFEDGKVIEYDALQGKDALAKYLSKSDNHKRLGEIALIDSDSPIAKTNKIYNYTLYDENVSTHLALGMAYKNTIKNGSLMNSTELAMAGCNECPDHLDFTIGDSTLSITAITKNNQKIELYSNGKFNYELINEKSPFMLE